MGGVGAGQQVSPTPRRDVGIGRRSIDSIQCFTGVSPHCGRDKEWYLRLNNVYCFFFSILPLLSAFSSTPGGTSVSLGVCLCVCAISGSPPPLPVCLSLDGR